MLALSSSARPGEAGLEEAEVDVVLVEVGGPQGAWPRGEGTGTPAPRKQSDRSVSKLPTGTRRVWPLRVPQRVDAGTMVAV